MSLIWAGDHFFLAAIKLEIQGIFSISSDSERRLMSTLVVLFQDPQEATITGRSISERAGFGSHISHNCSCVQGEKKRVIMKLMYFPFSQFP